MPDFDLLQKQQQSMWEAKGLDAPAKGPGAGPAPVKSMSPQGAAPAPAAGASPEELARMLDREKAQKELSGLFQIIGADHEGAKDPNMVSQAEYEKLCNQYSDIRTGNSQIKVDAGERKGEEADMFKAFLMGDIESMLQTEVGRSLINELSTQKDAGDKPLTTTIMGAASPTQAKAHTTERKQNAIDWSENGVGADMTVEYAPGKDVNKPGSTSPWFPMRSDVVLFHELTHALHGTRGEFEKGEVPQSELAPDDEKGVPLEEYATVGLGRFAGSKDPKYAVNENAYRAERRDLVDKPGMRRGDDDWAMERRTSYLTSNPAEEARYMEEKRRRQREQGEG